MKKLIVRANVELPEYITDLLSAYHKKLLLRKYTPILTEELVFVYEFKEASDED